MVDDYIISFDFQVTCMAFGTECFEWVLIYSLFDNVYIEFWNVKKLFLERLQYEYLNIYTATLPAKNDLIKAFIRRVPCFPVYF